MRGVERGGGPGDRPLSGSFRGSSSSSLSSSRSHYNEGRPTSRNPFARPLVPSSRPREEGKPPCDSVSGSNDTPLPPPASLASKYADWDEAPNKTWYTVGDLRDIRDLMQLPQRPQDLSPLIIAVEKHPHMRAANERKTPDKPSPFAYKERGGGGGSAGGDWDSRNTGRDGDRKWSGDYSRKGSPFAPHRGDNGPDRGSRWSEDFSRGGTTRRESPYGKSGRDRGGGTSDHRQQGEGGSRQDTSNPSFSSRDHNRDWGTAHRRKEEGLWDTPASAFDGADFDFGQGQDLVAAMEAERARFLGVEVRPLHEASKGTPQEEPQPTASALQESKMPDMVPLSVLEGTLSAQPSPVPVSPQLPTSINELNIDIDRLLFPSSGGAPLGGSSLGGEGVGLGEFGDQHKTGGDPFRSGLFSFAAPGAAISTIDLYRELNQGNLFGEVPGGPVNKNEPSSRLENWATSFGGEGASSKVGKDLPPPPAMSTQRHGTSPSGQEDMLKNMLGIGHPGAFPPQSPSFPPTPPVNDQASNDLLEILGFAGKTPPPSQPTAHEATTRQSAAPKQSPFAFHERKPAPTRKLTSVRPVAPRPLAHPHVASKPGLIPVNVLARKQVASPPIAPTCTSEPVNGQASSSEQSHSSMSTASAINTAVPTMSTAPAHLSSAPTQTVDLAKLFGKAGVALPRNVTTRDNGAAHTFSLADIERQARK